jgi:hypothetical protein
MQNEGSIKITSYTSVVGKQLNSSTYVDVDNARQRVLGVGATLDGDPQNGFGLLDGNSEVPLLVGHDKCTLHNNNPSTFHNLYFSSYVQPQP